MMLTSKLSMMNCQKESLKSISTKNTEVTVIKLKMSDTMSDIFYFLRNLYIAFVGIYNRKQRRENLTSDMTRS